MMLAIWGLFKNIYGNTEDFDHFMMRIMIGLFALFLVRCLIALYLGSWTLF